MALCVELANAQRIEACRKVTRSRLRRCRPNDPNLEEQLGEVVRALIVEALARERPAAVDGGRVVG